MSRCSDLSASQATTPTDVSDSSDSEDLPSATKVAQSSYALRYGVDVNQGPRSSMEDRCIAQSLTTEQAGTAPAAFFAVFDGHAGYQVAEYASGHFLDFLVTDEAFQTSPLSALKNAFHKTEQAWHSSGGTGRAGSTALAALVVDNELYLGNLGDCRAVLCRDSASLQLTKDHKADTEEERARLTSAGWDVSNDGYVFGELAVSRALGLGHYKADPSTQGAILSEPELHYMPLEKGDEFLVMASDGLWDVMSNQQVVRTARRELEMHNSPVGAAQRLVRDALKLKVCDNITVIVVCFKTSYALRRTNSRLNIRGCMGTCQG